MKKKQKVGIRVLQVFAIIFLILAILSTSVWFLVKGSLDKASETNAIPDLFGNEYIPITSDEFNEIAPSSNGSIVMLEKVEGELVPGTVVVYETPETVTDNAAYQGFSLGQITSLVIEDGSVVNIKSIKSGEEIAIPAELIKGKAAWQVTFLGTLFTLIDSTVGILFLVILPFAVFIILQLIVVIMRILNNNRENEYYGEYYDEYYAEYYDEYEDEYSTKKIAPVSSKSPVVHSSVSRKFDTGYFEKEPVESVALDGDSKTKIKSQTVTTIVDGEYAEPISSPDFDVAPPVETKARSFNPLFDPAVSAKDSKFATDTAGNFGHSSALGEDTKPVAKRSARADLDDLLNDVLADTAIDDSVEIPSIDSTEYSDISAQVDDFLKTLADTENNPAAELEQEIMTHTTLEFDMDAIRQRLLKEELLKDDDEKDFVKTPEPQEMLDKIMIELKDDALDFRFRNVDPNHVSISENNDGDGFSIKTPKYKANIKVEMDKE